jgi:uncharacterized membrane protein YeaQ/YmgE (transglycosylase-associated protein family)
VGGEAYGLVADALLAITGAFAVDWILELLSHNPTPWSNSTLLTIWGAAALPLLVHFFARRHCTAVERLVFGSLVCSKNLPSRT